MKRARDGMALHVAYRNAGGFWARLGSLFWECCWGAWVCSPFLLCQCCASGTVVCWTGNMVCTVVLSCSSGTHWEHVGVARTWSRKVASVRVITMCKSFLPPRTRLDKAVENVTISILFLVPARDVRARFAKVDAGNLRVGRKAASHDRGSCWAHCKRKLDW